MSKEKDEDEEDKKSVDSEDIENTVSDDEIKRLRKKS